MGSLVLMAPMACGMSVLTRKFSYIRDLVSSTPLGEKMKTFISMHMLWFNFIFGSIFSFLRFMLIIIHYHTQKQRKIKIEPRINLNHNTYAVESCPCAGNLVSSCIYVKYKIKMN